MTQHQYDTQHTHAEEAQVRSLLAPLADAPTRPPGLAEQDAQRRWLLPVLRDQVRRAAARRKRNQRYQVVGALALAAALVVGVAGVWQGSPEATQVARAERLQIEPGNGSVSVSGGAGSSTFSDRAQIDAEGQLEASDEATLKTSGGIVVEMAARTRVGLDGMRRPKTSQLHLERGSVNCQVPQLADGQAFSVVTSDARVVVHGTRFSVNKLQDGDTCVRVTEGLVEVVRGGVSKFLGPGEQSGCRAPVPSELEPEAQEPQEEATRVAKVKRRSAKDKSSSKEPAGTLESETLLVSEALSAERRGDADTARTRYRELLRRFPSSPLAPEARKGLARVTE